MNRSCGCCAFTSGSPYALSPVWNNKGYLRSVIVAGSRLTIDRSITLPPEPTFRTALSIPQLVEYSLSPPLGPDCCVSTTKACAIHIRCQPPAFCISIGIGHADG